MKQPLIGILPLYLKLYDDVKPEVREAFSPFLDTIAAQFRARGLDTSVADICCVENEFAAAVAKFEREEVALVVTVHLAYSPSLESADILAATQLPILMLDTTMDADFGQTVSPERIMFNHGIHGVQDLASVLRRKGKHFEIVAGHIDNAEMLDRAAGMARAAFAAKCLKTTRALRIGSSFEGMGDFAPPETVMEWMLGIDPEEIRVKDLAADAAAITDDAIAAELERDRESFTIEAPEEVHRRSVRAGLALRKRLDEGGFSAFSMNFLEFQSGDEPLATVPFLEASKAMARGLGYAGEGDVLTASLVGALNQAFGKTTFTEVFCPDWTGDALFLSHMGEINPEVAGDTPRLIEKDFPFTPARNPAIITCALDQGPAVLVNLAPGPEDTFGLIVAPVQILEDTTVEAMKNAIRGWIRPELPVELFLEEYSINGGTHHSALVLGDRASEIVAFGAFADIEVTTL